MTHCGGYRPNSFKTLKLTEAFTLAVGQPLDREGFEKALPASGKKVVIRDAAHPDTGKQRLDPSRWNVSVDEKGIIQKISLG